MAPIPNPADVARRLGLAGPGDLILHLPLRYLDETRLVPLDEARPGGLTQVEGHVLHAETHGAELRGDDGPGLVMFGLAIHREPQRAIRSRAQPLQNPHRHSQGIARTISYTVR